MNIPKSILEPFGVLGIPTIKPQTETRNFTTESGLEMTMIKVNVPSRKLKTKWRIGDVEEFLDDHP
jgi:hypothetical protein